VKVFVVGAGGFIGRRLTAALTDSGHEVVCGVRAGTGPVSSGRIAVDFTRDHHIDDWMPRLHGVDAVVNAVGILRESGAQTFAALHDAAPRALFAACVQAGVRKVVQISALGADAGARSPYHLSKRRTDCFLASLPLAWTIVRPSLVFGAGGASARLFAILAVLPVTPLPGRGDQPVQPIHIDDLCEALLHVVDQDAFAGYCIDAVGPHALTFRAFIASLRAQLGLSPARFIAVPEGIVRSVTRVASRFPGMLFDEQALDMLERGNVAPAQGIAEVLGKPPRPVERFIGAGEAPGLADSARIGWLLPVLRASVALVWIATGLISLGIFPLEHSYALLAAVGVTGKLASLALYGAAALDLAFGIGILALRHRRWLWRAQIALIVAYSVIIAVRLPEFWLHPFGPLLKNVPLLAAIMLLHEFEEH
jgi:uncharacterized protein YbjT (DUF2867 family)